MTQTYLIVQHSQYDLGMLIVAWHCHQCVGMLPIVIPRICSMCWCFFWGLNVLGILLDVFKLDIIRGTNIFVFALIFWLPLQHARGVTTSSLGQTLPLSMFCPMILVLPKLPNKLFNVIWPSHCATQHSFANSDYQTWLQLNRSQKSNKRLMAKTITRETKKEGQRKAKRCTTRRN